MEAHVFESGKRMKLNMEKEAGWERIPAIWLQNGANHARGALPPSGRKR
jgi:hypothetical protein